MLFVLRVGIAFWLASNTLTSRPDLAPDVAAGVCVVSLVFAAFMTAALSAALRGARRVVVAARGFPSDAQGRPPPERSPVPEHRRERRRSEDAVQEGFLLDTSVLTVGSRGVRVLQAPRSPERRFQCLPWDPPPESQGPQARPPYEGRSDGRPSPSWEAL